MSAGGALGWCVGRYMAQVRTRQFDPSHLSRWCIIVGVVLFSLLFGYPTSLSNIVTEGFISEKTDTSHAHIHTYTYIAHHPINPINPISSHPDQPPSQRITLATTTLPTHQRCHPPSPADDSASPCSSSSSPPRCSSRCSPPPPGRLRPAARCASRSRRTRRGRRRDTGVMACRWSAAERRWKMGCGRRMGRCRRRRRGGMRMGRRWGARAEEGEVKVEGEVEVGLGARMGRGGGRVG